MSTAASGARPFSKIPDILEAITPDRRFGSYFEKNSGRLFDELVLTSDRMRFEPTDLVAIGMLSVSLHPEGVKTLLLDRDFSAHCSRLLREIPTDLALADCSADVISPGSAANELWRLLRTLKGAQTGVTVISKLMAAKRPLLFPVWDARVDLIIKRPGGRIWEPMHTLVSDSHTLERLQRLTAAAPAHVGLLRRIDVALWRHAQLKPTPLP